jgi:hypothetical protein
MSFDIGIINSRSIPTEVVLFCFFLGPSTEEQLECYSEAEYQEEVGQEWCHHLVACLLLVCQASEFFHPSNVPVNL